MLVLVDSVTQVTNAIKAGGDPEVKDALANAFAGAASRTGGQLTNKNYWCSC